MDTNYKFINCIFLAIIITFIQCNTAIHNDVFVNATSAEFSQDGHLTLFQSKPFSGTIFKLNILGDTISTIQFQDGREDGLMFVFGEKKQILEERKFVNGWKQGIHKGWYENGKQKFIYEFKDDNFHGSYQEWTPKGLLFRKMNFVKGKEEGMQSVYNHEGKIKSNYLMKNGVRYGLLGTRSCINKKNKIEEKI